MRWLDVETQQQDFAEFYRRSKDECLFTVLVSVGDRNTARDLVAEAFARAWASWRTVSRQQSIYIVQHAADGTVIVIDPSAMPTGTGLFIFDVPARALPDSSSTPAPIDSAGLVAPPPIPVIGGRYLRINLVYGGQSCPLDGTA